MLPIAPQYSLPLTNPLNRRATHLHLIAHIGGSISSAGTYSGGTIPHIGQVFSSSPSSVKSKQPPYNTNTVAITLNSVDRVFTEQASVTAGYSDVVTIKKLGSALSDGLLGPSPLVWTSRRTRALEVAAVPEQELVPARVVPQLVVWVVLLLKWSMYVLGGDEVRSLEDRLLVD